MPNAASAALPHDEPGVDIETLASLPFHVMGRFQNPAMIGRCRVDGIDSLSSKEIFERIRDLSLRLSALGIEVGDRVAIISESRPE
jgi:long-subunit acyl-CoA synthetase (AMP-forming)